MKVIPLILLFFTFNLATAKPLKIGVQPSNREFTPHIINWAKAAFFEANIEMHLVDLPGLRSIDKANQGVIDGDIFRFENSVLNFPNLIKVDAALSRSEMWVVVTEERICPEFNDLPLSKPVGMLGTKYFEQVYSFSRVGYEVAPNPMAVIKMLAKDRADYSVMSKNVKSTLQSASKIALKICYDEPIIEIKGYLYLHKKHHLLVEDLRRAFESTRPAYDPTFE